MTVAVVRMLFEICAPGGPGEECPCPSLAAGRRGVARAVFELGLFDERKSE